MKKEEAIKILRETHDSALFSVRTALETLIPELRESEDERVRKAIINYILYKADGVSEEDEHKWISWLEKQKEQNLLPGFEMTSEEIMEHPLFLEGFDVGREVGHIEAEQKPAEWSEDYREEDIQTRFAFYTYKDDLGVLYLSNVFVEEASRNHGFGTRILRAAEKVAETIGATTISLKVKQDSPANAWYRKNGYGYVAFEDGYDWLEKNLEYLKPKRKEQPVADCRDFEQGLEEVENEEFEKELHRYWLEQKQKGVIVDGSIDDYITVQEVARHFAEWGVKNLKK